MLDIVQNKVALPQSFYATHGLPDKTSENYAAIPTFRVVHALEKAGFELTKASQKGVRKAKNAGYQMHVATFRHNSLTGDNTLVPQIALCNSSNGTCAFRLIAGAYVFACSNGLFFGKEQFASFGVSHKGQDLTNRVITAAFEIIYQAQIQAQTITEWQSIPMPYARQLDFAYHARALRFETIKDASGKDIWPVELGDLLYPRHWEQRQDNLFNIYNRVQETLLRGGIKSLGQNGKIRNTRPIKSIETDLAINADLFALAKQFA